MEKMTSKEKARRRAICDKHGGLAIRCNNTAANDPCALCGARTDPSVGPELFLNNTYELVCLDCARQFEPELARCYEGSIPALADLPF